MSVRASNISSRVPNPPGKTTKAVEYFTNIVFRTKKYRKLIERSTYGLMCCSKGSSMLQPMESPFPSCAPRFAASMIPGPPPVITGKPSLPSSLAVVIACSYTLSSFFVRAEPKIVTALRTSCRVSNPSTNSPMIRSTRQGSEWVKDRRSLTVGDARRRSSSVVDLGELLDSCDMVFLHVIEEG